MSNVDLGSGSAGSRSGSGASITPLEIEGPESSSAAGLFRRTGSGSGSGVGGEAGPSPATTDAANRAARRNAPVVAVPAATTVERGRPVAIVSAPSIAKAGDSGVQRRSSGGVGDEEEGLERARTDDSSFDASEVFVDVDVGDALGLGEDGRIREEDLDRLLGTLPDDLDHHRGRRRGNCPCCPRAVRNGPCSAAIGKVGDNEEAISRRVGNMIVLFPNLYSRTGIGIVGPQWFGPVCTLGLLTLATAYFAPTAYRTVGPVSSFVCLLFYAVGASSLGAVACSDPGVVRSDADRASPDATAAERNGYSGVSTTGEGAGNAGGGRDWTNWRYCDLCGVYQPPDAAHCPDCNVCVEGYDHHCPWMGTCIGKRNFRAFCAFNMSWLFYFLYALLWVTLFGPFTGKKPAE